VVDAIIGRDARNLKGIHAFQTSDVIAILIRIQATLVMGVDAAVGAEIVPRGIRVELLHLQHLAAANNFEP
jgi:hypothetical protein